MFSACACFSPIRGWLRKASSQSDSGRCCQQWSAAAKRVCSSAKGRIATNCAAQPGEPQQKNFLRCLIRRQRVPPRQHVFMWRGPREIPVAGCRRRAAGKRRWNECRRWERLRLPEPAGLREPVREPTPASSIPSARRNRNGVTAMLPMASRTSSILSSETLPSPARQSLAIACALWAPTLREYA